MCHASAACLNLALNLQRREEPIRVARYVHPSPGAHQSRYPLCVLLYGHLNEANHLGYPRKPNGPHDVAMRLPQALVAAGETVVTTSPEARRAAVEASGRWGAPAPPTSVLPALSRTVRIVGNLRRYAGSEVIHQSTW